MGHEQKAAFERGGGMREWEENTEGARYKVDMRHEQQATFEREREVPAAGD